MTEDNVLSLHDTCVIQVIVTEGNVLSVIPVLYR